MNKTIRQAKAWGLVMVLMAMLQWNCSVKAPEVTVTGEKTALENQVIGTYQQIEQDAWTLASVRSANPGQQQALPREKKKVIEAIQGRKFNKDDVDEFKRAGLVGENNMGLLEIRNLAKLEADPELKTRVTKIVESENNYRKIIMERIMLLNESAAEAGNENVARIFSKMNQDSSEPGTWIQQVDGTWIKKGQ